jgi:hypothetical protein
MAASAAGFQFGFFIRRSIRESERNVSSVNFINTRLAKRKRENKRNKERERQKEREKEREENAIE